MSKPILEVAGFVTTERFLNVHFTLREGTVPRYHELKVRLTDLANCPEFNAALTKTLVRIWKESWEDDTPIFSEAAALAELGEPWDKCADDCTGCASPRHAD